MKKPLIIIVSLYQSFFSGLIKNILGIDRMCKFSPTCSEYARRAISKEGVFVGLKKSTIRILKCF